MDTIKIQLEDGDIPENWYNIASDFKTPMLPPLHPGTGEPVGPEALAPLFPMALIQQEVSQERWIEIPDEVRHREKWRQALDMLDEITGEERAGGWGLHRQPVVADAGYGDCTEFRLELEARLISLHRLTGKDRIGAQGW